MHSDGPHAGRACASIAEGYAVAEKRPPFDAQRLKAAMKTERTQKYGEEGLPSASVGSHGPGEADRETPASGGASHVAPAYSW